MLGGVLAGVCLVIILIMGDYACACSDLFFLLFGVYWFKRWVRRFCFVCVWVMLIEWMYVCYIRV